MVLMVGFSGQRGLTEEGNNFCREARREPRLFS